MTYSISNDMQSFLLVKELGAQLTAKSSSGRAKQIAKNCGNTSAKMVNFR
jgi:hypothetical protein